jgi:acyl transferase domain-containing protein
MEPIREPIAIIGSGCRFPGGANTVSKLWDLLEQPQDVSEPISSERFNIDRFYHPTGSHHGTTNVKNAYFIAGNARKFDAPFFSVLPSGASFLQISSSLARSKVSMVSHWRLLALFGSRY